MLEIQDDKAQHVVPFILERFALHSELGSSAPFFIGLNGVQGAGKSVLVSILQKALQSPPHDISTVVFSLDDLYLTHSDQLDLAAAHPDNPLLQHRGQPKTHDIPLALSVFESLRAGKPTAIPQYNKAAFSGQGDRMPETEWEIVNQDSSHPIRVVLFEGWCVGYRPLTPTALEQKWQAALDEAKRNDGTYTGQLAHNTLSSLTTINNALHSYDQLTDQLDAFIHIDAADSIYVYKWRLEQEHGLWETKGSGMSDDSVRKFVDGYYPSYELYTNVLREGVFKKQGVEGKGRQMRLIVGDDRKVREVIVI
jgi:D-glycerate 3-kinase